MGTKGLKNIRRVYYSRWDEGADEPEVSQGDARIDELHYDDYSGDLYIGIETEDGSLSLSIPIKASKNWNNFVESLPKWD